MKLALMLMGGSALVFVGLLGLYFNTNINGSHSFDLVEISQMHIDAKCSNIFFPFAFVALEFLLPCSLSIPGCLTDIHPHQQQLPCFWPASP